ncbi:ODA11 [Symbiodinium sp. KB8]|nr:ODA11 [Symbiodinium sp. KB8]
MESDFGFTNDPDGYLLLKISQLIELLEIRHSVFLMGNPGSFKSFLWKVLKNAKTKHGEKTTVVDFSPKAITTNELYGVDLYAFFSPPASEYTREWKDGILSKTMRDLGLIPDTHPKWIMLDGDLDANWIESMNSVMDDSRLLTLPSNERIPLKMHMKMIFEIRDLNYATPATATRAGIVCMSDKEGVQWQCYVQSWIKKCTYPEAFKEQLALLFDKYCSPTLTWIRKSTKIQVPYVEVALISSLCSLLDARLPSHNLEAVEAWFVFCIIFATGSSLAEVDGVDYRKAFSNWWKNEMKTIKYPTKGLVFDLYVRDSRLEEWSTLVEPLQYRSTTPMGEITVPTTETVCLDYFMKALIEVNHPVMLIGLAGCGKTQSCTGLLKRLDHEVFMGYKMNMSYYTDSTMLQTMMEIPLEKKAGKLYAPPGKLQMIYFIDDLNMPALDKYNTQSAIELIKQKQDYNHWYDRVKIQVKDIGGTQYLCCMNPTAGSFTVNPRLQRHFWTSSVQFPEQNALNLIYSTFMKGHFDTLSFKVPVQEISNWVIKAALSFHTQVSANFRKTAQNMHYEFNIRHMSGVFSGLLKAKPSEFMDAEKLVLLWIHESERIYGDRLVSMADLKKLRQLTEKIAKQMFSKHNLQKYFQEKNPEPIIFAPFSRGHHNMEDGGVYDKIKDMERLSQILQEAMRDYDSTFPSMDLVLFEDAMKHVARISRIISSPSGHPLLVGVGGSGRQHMIIITSSYGLNDLKTDLQYMYKRAGEKDEGVMFLFTDNQIADERFFVFFNDLLSSGEITDLYPSEDKDSIRNAVRSAAKGMGIVDTPDNLRLGLTIPSPQEPAHVAVSARPFQLLAFSGRMWAAWGNCFGGVDVKVLWCFPSVAVYVCIFTNHNMFQPWPEDALLNVAQKFLTKLDELGAQDSPARLAIVDFFPHSFEALCNVKRNDGVTFFLGPLLPGCWAAGPAGGVELFEMIGATFKLELSGPDLSFRDRAIVRDAGTGCPGRSDSADSDKRRHSLSVASYVYHPHAEPSPLVHGGPIIESSNQLGWLKASWFPVQMRIRGSFPICYCAASDETNYLASLGISLPPAESPCDRDNALYHYVGVIYAMGIKHSEIPIAACLVVGANQIQQDCRITVRSERGGLSAQDMAELTEGNPAVPCGEATASTMLQPRIGDASAWTFQVPQGTSTVGFTTASTDSGAQRLLKVCYCESYASASSDGACGAADWQHAGTLSLVGFAGDAVPEVHCYRGQLCRLSRAEAFGMGTGDSVVAVAGNSSCASLDGKVFSSTSLVTLLGDTTARVAVDIQDYENDMATICYCSAAARGLRRHEVLTPRLPKYTSGQNGQGRFFNMLMGYVRSSGLGGGLRFDCVPSASQCPNEPVLLHGEDAEVAKRGNLFLAEMKYRPCDDLFASILPDILPTNRPLSATHVLLQIDRDAKVINANCQRPIDHMRTSTLTRVVFQLAGQSGNALATSAYALCFCEGNLGCPGQAGQQSVSLQHVGELRVLGAVRSVVLSADVGFATIPLKVRVEEASYGIRCCAKLGVHNVHQECKDLIPVREEVLRYPATHWFPIVLAEPLDLEITDGHSTLLNAMGESQVLSSLHFAGGACAQNGTGPGLDPFPCRQPDTLPLSLQLPVRPLAWARRPWRRPVGGALGTEEIAELSGLTSQMKAVPSPANDAELRGICDRLETAEGSFHSLPCKAMECTDQNYARGLVPGEHELCICEAAAVTALHDCKGWHRLGHLEIFGPYPLTDVVHGSVGLLTKVALTGLGFSPEDSLISVPVTSGSIDPGIDCNFVGIRGAICRGRLAGTVQHLGRGLHYYTEIVGMLNNDAQCPELEEERPCTGPPCAATVDDWHTDPERPFASAPFELHLTGSNLTGDLQGVLIKDEGAALGPADGQGLCRYDSTVVARGVCSTTPGLTEVTDQVCKFEDGTPDDGTHQVCLCMAASDGRCFAFLPALGSINIQLGVVPLLEEESQSAAGVAVAVVMVLLCLCVAPLLACPGLRRKLIKRIKRRCCRQPDSKVSAIPPEQKGEDVEDVDGDDEVVSKEGGGQPEEEPQGELTPRTDIDGLNEQMEAPPTPDHSEKERSPGLAAFEDIPQQPEIIEPPPDNRDQADAEESEASLTSPPSTTKSRKDKKKRKEERRKAKEAPTILTRARDLLVAAATGALQEKKQAEALVEGSSHLQLPRPLPPPPLRSPPKKTLPALPFNPSFHSEGSARSPAAVEALAKATAILQAAQKFKNLTAAQDDAGLSAYGLSMKALSKAIAGRDVEVLEKALKDAEAAGVGIELLEKARERLRELQALFFVLFV